MPTTYTETPDNFNEIGTFVEKEINGIKKIFYLAQRVIFYDACSFQKHSHLPDKEIKVLMNYYKIHGTVVFITKCILMLHLYHLSVHIFSHLRFQEDVTVYVRISQ